MGLVTNNDRTILREPHLQGPRRLALRPPALEQIRGPNAPALHLLHEPDVVIGRAAPAQVQIPSETLSRQHVSLTKRDGEVMFTDLDSMNGVYLNGVRAHSAILRDGDVLELGDAAFVFWERAP